MSYDESIKKVFAYLKDKENIAPLNNYHKKKLGYSDSEDIWEITTEILNSENKVQIIKLHLCFPLDFPLVFPKIFLSKEDFFKIKYVPHLEVNKSICLFVNKAEPNVNAPELVTEMALNRAKKVLEDGLNRTNFEDFEDEFEAYWSSNYSNDDNVYGSYLLVIKEPLKEKFQLLELKTSFNKYTHIIHQNEDVAKTFIENLKNKRISFKEYWGYVFHDLKLFDRPPFNLTNGDVLDYFKGIKNHETKKFLQIYENNKAHKLFLFSKNINSQERYFGWHHDLSNIRRQGVKQTKTKSQYIKSWIKNKDRIDRITPRLYSSERLLKRSSGFLINNRDNKYCMIGTGSIGSNLIHYLNSSTSTEFRLIDTDLLNIENLGRHYLGFNALGKYKTLGLKELLSQNSPIQKIETKEKSIIEIINQTPEFINDCDYIFIAIGEYNIEHFISNSINEGEISKPTFFIWVEPYLLGGHCIFINPKRNNFEDYFDKQEIFKFNVIGNYDNEILSLKEAGCQTNFTPYSSNNIQIFLGMMYPYINHILNDKNSDSQVLSWIGDKNLAEKMDIELSEFGLSKENNSIVKNIL